MRLSYTVSLEVRLCILLIFCALNFSSTSNQRRSYRTTASGPDRYDRSVTTFDPSGRLLQIEYAQQAARKNSLGLVMIVVKDTCYIVTPSALQFESSLSPNATPIIHRISKSIFFVGLGLVGDIRAVASHLRVQAQQHLYNFDEEWTVEQAATAFSNLQHQLTHQSGVRPLGITGFFFGTEAQPYWSKNTAMKRNLTDPLPTAQLFHCSPGGLAENCLYCCTGPHEAELLSLLKEQYLQFNNRTEAEIVHELVHMMNPTVVKDRDALNNEQELDVWVVRKSHSTQPHVSCFRGLSNAARSFAKLQEYYNNRRVEAGHGEVNKS